MNNAVINFLFNSRGALKELNNFKNNFTKSIDAISNSSIGRLGRISTVLGSIFSVKSAVRQTKAVKDFINIYGDLPLDKVNKFANSISLMAGDIETGTDEALVFLGKLQDGLSLLNKTEGIFADSTIQSIFRLGGFTISADKDDVFSVVEKIRQLYKSGLVDDEMMRPFFEQLGLSNTADLYQFFKQSDEDWRRTEQFAQKMGGTTQNQIDSIRKWNESIALLQGRFREFGNSLIEKNLPNIIDKITGALDWFLQQGEGTQNAIMGIVAALLFGSPIINGVKTVFSGLGGILKSLFYLFKGIGLLMGSTVGMFVIIGASLWALSNNFLGLHDALDGVINIWDNWISGLTEDSPLLAKIMRQITKLFLIMSHPVDFVKAVQQDIEKQKKANPNKGWFLAAGDAVRAVGSDFFEDLKKNQSNVKSFSDIKENVKEAASKQLTPYKDYFSSLNLQDVQKLTSSIQNQNVDNSSVFNININESNNPKETAKEIFKEYQKNVRQYSNFGTTALIGE